MAEENQLSGAQVRRRVSQLPELTRSAGIKLILVFSWRADCVAYKLQSRDDSRVYL